MATVPTPPPDAPRIPCGAARWTAVFDENCPASRRQRAFFRENPQTVTQRVSCDDPQHRDAPVCSSVPKFPALCNDKGWCRWGMHTTQRDFEELCAAEAAHRSADFTTE